MNRIAHRSILATLGLAVVAISAVCLLDASIPPGQNWTHYVRIGGHSLQQDNAEEIVRSATASNVFGIEVDNDITGRYESFLDPTEKLKAIRAVAEKAHATGNYAFVYIAGTECITANADASPHTMAKDHPDWLQRKMSGEPAVFGGGTAFWIQKGDEDVWISPYATEWRTIYMERVRQIAATGIDGIYVDIPYWMTHFDGWEDSWASFDDYTVAAFKKQTGLDARRDLKLGDFSDANFRKWIDFRIQTLTDFMAEIDRNAKSVNPRIMTIPEIYPGIEEEAVRVGADVYEMYGVVDAIAHEYEFGGGDHMASSRTPLDWFRYQIGMQTFRAFARGKATWILNYSWDGDKRIAPPEPMKNLAMSQVMAGANFWDAQGHVMSGSNDMATRAAIFAWIRDHEERFYARREPMHPVGIYFSPSTRNYYTASFMQSYQGLLMLLMQNHLEYQIVTPKTLNEFRGGTLILPDVKVIGESERSWLRNYLGKGGRVVITGENATGLQSSTNVRLLAKCPGKAHLAALERDFGAASQRVEIAFLDGFVPSREVEVLASPWIAAQTARVNGVPHVFLASFKGLKGGENAVQEPETGAKVVVRGKGTVYFLPFMGEVQKVRGVEKNGRTTYVLPEIHKGAVVWFEKK